MAAALGLADITLLPSLLAFAMYLVPTQAPPDLVPHDMVGATFSSGPPLESASSHYPGAQP